MAQVAPRIIHIINKICVLHCLLFIMSCAQQGRPTGGPKDTSPPKIKKSEPLNYSTEFSKNKIKITFDEFVQLRNPNNHVIISPPFNEPPDFKLQGKTLAFKVNLDSLREKTTYTINFGNAIVDYTEGNELDSNTFVFSTGNYLDSMMVKGVVKDGFDLSPKQDVWVMLYENLTDSAPQKEPPVYFSKTKEDGTFSIHHIANGVYKMFALSDKNSNYKFDLPNEEIAFLDTHFIPNDSVHFKLHLFAEDVEQQYLKKVEAALPGKFTFVFNLPTENANAVPLNFSAKKPWYIPELGVNKDTLIYWLTDTEGIDTLKFQIMDKGLSIDTVDVVLPKPTKKEKKSRKKNKLDEQPKRLAITTNIRSPFKMYNPITLNTETPIKEFDKGEIQLLQDSVPVQFEFNSVNDDRRHYEIIYQWKEGSQYELLIAKGGFTDIFGFYNDSLAIKFATGYWDDYGKLNLKLDFPDNGHPYIIQLLDQGKGVLEERLVKAGETIIYPYLTPRKYGFKLIYDVNSNGKWDTGDYNEKRQPEKVLFFSDEPDIQGGFETDLEWKSK